jgi:hypothetical protein
VGIPPLSPEGSLACSAGCAERREIERQREHDRLQGRRRRIVIVFLIVVVITEYLIISGGIDPIVFIESSLAVGGVLADRLFTLSRES